MRSVDFGTGAKIFEATVATNSLGGKIEIHVGSRGGCLLGVLEVKNTEGVLNWKTISCKVNKIKEIHDVFFVFKGGNGNLFNFDWWRFLK